MLGSKHTVYVLFILIVAPFAIFVDCYNGQTEARAPISEHMMSFIGTPYHNFRGVPGEL